MNAPQPLFGLPGIDDITKLLPPQVADAIKGTLGTILDPNHPGLNIGDPQPPGPPPIPVKAGSAELSGAVKAIDTAVSVIDAALKFGFLIPDNYESGLRALRGALETIRDWLT